MRDDLGAAVVYVGGRLPCHAGVGQLLPCGLACQLQVDAAHAAGHTLLKQSVHQLLWVQGS